MIMIPIIDLRNKMDHKYEVNLRIYDNPKNEDDPKEEDNRE